MSKNTIHIILQEHTSYILSLAPTKRIVIGLKKYKAAREKHRKGFTSYGNLEG